MASRTERVGYKLPIRIGRARNIGEPSIEKNKVLRDRAVHRDMILRKVDQCLTSTGKVGGVEGILLLLKEAKHCFSLHYLRRRQSLVRVECGEDLEGDATNGVIGIIGLYVGSGWRSTDFRAIRECYVTLQ